MVSQAAEDESARHVLPVSPKSRRIWAWSSFGFRKRFCALPYWRDSKVRTLPFRLVPGNHRQACQRITNDRRNDRAGGEAIAGPDLQARQDGQCPGYPDLGALVVIGLSHLSFDRGTSRGAAIASMYRQNRSSSRLSPIPSAAFRTNVLTASSRPDW